MKLETGYGITFSEEEVNEISEPGLVSPILPFVWSWAVTTDPCADS